MRLFLPTHSVDAPSAAAGCARCGRDLGSRAPWAIFCPNCGRRLHEPATVRSRLARVGSGALHLIGIGRAGEPQGEPIEKMPRSPMVLGYGNALYTLGWRYERGGANGNKPEAVRCYRKSARLGNLDATVRLAVIADEPPPIPVIPL